MHQDNYKKQQINNPEQVIPRVCLDLQYSSFLQDRKLNTLHQ